MAWWNAWKRFLLLGCLALMSLASTANVLKYGVKHQAHLYDPHRAYSAVASIVLRELFVGLVAIGADGSLLPGCAESWRISPDKKELIFHLRSPLFWSDGTALTAFDFEYSFRRIFRIKALYANQYVAIRGAKTFLQTGQMPVSFGVTALDARTLRLQLAYPDPELLAALSRRTAYPIPRHQTEKLGNEWSEAENLVSNGPFRFKRSSTYRLVLAKNPHFFAQQDVQLKGVEFISPKPHQSLGRMVLNGELDVTSKFSHSQYNYILSNAPGLLRTYPNWSVYWYAINHQRKELADPQVRRALYLAIDRSAITRYFQVGAQPAYSMVPADLLSLPAEISERDIARDLQKARQLMIKSGYGPEHRLGLEIKTHSKDHDKVIAGMIRRDWSNIFVDAAIQTMTPANLMTDLEAGNFMVGRLGWKESIGNPMLFMTLFRSGFRFNIGGWQSDEYDALLKQSVMLESAVDRKSLLEQANQILLDESVALPLYYGSNQWLVSQRVKGWVENNRDVHPCRWLSLGDELPKVAAQESK